MEPRGHGATKHTESRSHRDMATRLRRGPAPGSPCHLFPASRLPFPGLPCASSAWALYGLPSPSFQKGGVCVFGSAYPHSQRPAGSLCSSVQCCLKFPEAQLCSRLPTARKPGINNYNDIITDNHKSGSLLCAGHRDKLLTDTISRPHVHPE